MTDAIRPLTGPLRIAQGTHFEDDSGPVLPLFYHYGEGLGVWRRNRAWCERQLDAIAAHGHGVRTWLTLGWYEFWRGREVAPIDFYGRGATEVAAWPDYDEQLHAYLQALAHRGLRLYASFGDLQMFADNEPRMLRFLQHVGRLCRQASPVVVMADINEAWQNVWHDGWPTPNQVRKLVRAFADEAHISLWGLSAPPLSSEAVDALNAWSSPHLFVIHSVRVDESVEAGQYEDDVTILGRLFETTSPPGGKRPRKRVGWQAEPTGPGEYVSVGRMSNPQTLALMGAMSWMSRQAWTYMSSVGVRDDGNVPIEVQPGFREVSWLNRVLPIDLMTWDIAVPESHREAVVTGARTSTPSADGFARVDQRIDHRGRRVVALASGGSGRRAIRTNRAIFDAHLYDPVRGEVWNGALERGGELREVDTTAVGILLVGRFR